MSGTAHAPQQRDIGGQTLYGVPHSWKLMKQQQALRKSRAKSPSNKKG